MEQPAHQPEIISMLIRTIVQDTGNATTAAWITSHAKTTIFLILFMDGVISPKTFAVERGIVMVDPAMMNVVREMILIVQSPMDFSKILKTAWNIGNVTMISHNIILVTHKMDNNCCFVSRMCNVIGLIELTVEIDQFAIYMMKIAFLNQNTLLNHHQFAKEFLAIMETDSTQKAVVHNVFADVLEDFIMKHVAHLDYFSTLQSTNAIGLVTSMVANKLFK